MACAQCAQPLISFVDVPDGHRAYNFSARAKNAADADIAHGKLLNKNANRDSPAFREQGSGRCSSKPSLRTVLPPVPLAAIDSAVLLVSAAIFQVPQIAFDLLPVGILDCRDFNSETMNQSVADVDFVHH